MPRFPQAEKYWGWPQFWTCDQWSSQTVFLVFWMKYLVFETGYLGGCIFFFFRYWVSAPVLGPRINVPAASLSSFCTGGCCCCCCWSPTPSQSVSPQLLDRSTYINIQKLQLWVYMGDSGPLYFYIALYFGTRHIYMLKHVLYLWCMKKWHRVLGGQTNLRTSQI